MSYLWIKTVHLSAVTFNIAFFTLRFYWMLKNAPLGKQAWPRIVSQFNDTILLVAGIGLAMMSQQYPLTHDWLTAKVLALVIYIIAGSLALKWAKNRSLRILFGCVAFGSIGYILSVALTRTPYSWTLLSY